MSKALWFIAVLGLALPQQCLADDPLQGRVQERNMLKRVNRPAMPSRPLGEALEHVSNAVRGHKKSGFDLTASSISNTLDKGIFDLSKPADRGDNKQLKAGAGAAESKDLTDKDLVIAWENWHKQLCSTIYRHWLIYGNIPGEAAIALHIGRNGDIRFDMSDYHVDASEEFSMNQRQLFEHSIDRTLQMLERSEVLEFPARSQRQEVSLTTKFSFTESDGGPSGYTWKRGDYERVNQR